jgi:single-stranded DNA-binding protein
LAVNRAYKKSCYIPCIAWGKDAKYVSELSVGTKISLNGRIQSREYGKKISGGEYEIRTAYEVSIRKVGKVDTDDKD